MQPETVIRLEFFAAILAVMMVWELLACRRPEPMRRQRWPSNFMLLLIYSLLLLVIPISPLWAALQSIYLKFGLLFWYPLPLWWSIGISLLVLDCAIYWQHRLFHRVPLFWRLHRAHHSDQAIDVTTGFRFHPAEIILSLLIKTGIIILLGAPLLSVLIFEILLNGSAMFSHSNIRLPGRLDRLLRLLIVTPDMHRVHHSVERPEHDRNFGFNLSVWDRLFGSYRDQPQAGHAAMHIGLKEFADIKESRLDKILLQPLR